MQPAAQTPALSGARRAFAALCCMAACAWPVAAHAQVAFLMDLMMGVSCLANNWNTPPVQQWLAQMPSDARFGLYADITLSDSEKRCLVERSPIPQALCHKVVERFISQRSGQVGGGEPFLGLSDAESGQIIQDRSDTCPAPHPTDAQWLPADLQPSAATRALLQRANDGHLPSQLEAARIYDSGLGVPLSKERAAYWLTQAALQGDATSRLLIARAYQVGRPGFEQNPRKALQLFLPEAQKGNAYAMWSAFELLNAPPDIAWADRQIQPDPKQAQHWLQQAADKGFEPAVLELATRLQNGTPLLPANPGKALQLLQQASSTGCTRCMLQLADLIDAGTAAPRDWRAAHQWRRKADALGENGFTVELLRYSPWDDTAELDDAAYMRRLLPLAQQGDVNAQLSVALNYYYGTGLTQDQTEAVRWWQKAAKAGDPIGQRMYGKLLLMGWEERGTRAATPRRPNVHGLDWLQKAAAQNDAQAMRDLAYWYAQEAPASSAAEKKAHILQGINWLEQAAAAGHRPAENRERAQAWRTALEP